MTSPHFLLPAVVVVAAAVSSLHADPAPIIGTEAVASLNAAGGQPFSSDSSGFTMAGGVTFFAGSDSFSNTGRELWATLPGGSTGPGPVADLFPGLPGSRPEPLGIAGTALLFSADDGVHGMELWKVDPATRNCTLVKDLYPGAGGASGLSRTFSAGPWSWFTQLVISSGGLPGFPFPRFNYTLWRTDGTDAGTVAVATSGLTGEAPAFDIEIGAVASGSWAWFAGGNKVYRSDGTAAGTVPVLTLSSTERVSSITAVGGSVYVAIYENLTLTYRPNPNSSQTNSAIFRVNARQWRFTGTTSTVLVDGAQSEITRAFASGSRLFYSWKRFTVQPSVVNQPNGSSTLNAGSFIEGLSSVDNSAGSAAAITLPAGYVCTGFRVSDGTRAYFLAAPGPGGDNRLFASNGGAPVLLRDTGLTDDAPMAWLFGLMGSTVVFPVRNGTAWEMWKTNGTAAGTAFVSSATGNGYVAFGSALYFIHDDGVHGAEVWRTDGTPAGTQMLKDVNPAPGIGSEPSFLTAVAAHAPTGTPAKLWWQANDGVNGAEPWASDGSSGGTAMVYDVAASGVLPAPSGLTTAGDVLYFQWSTPATGLELWRSDGTASGTKVLRDIRPGVDSSLPGALVMLGNITFFTADDGEHGREWWKTDGTEAGTMLLADIWPGPTGSAPSDAAVWNGFLYFAAADDVNGRELWRTDGTAAGTELVRDCRLGPDGSNPAGLTGANSLLFFTADDGSTGAELWRSDGTDAGTGIAHDLQPGIDGANIGTMASLGGMVVFEANAGASGRELWRSNGQPGGTQFLKDLNTGPPNAAAADWTRLGSRVIFTATLGTARRVWSTDGSVAGTVNLAAAGLTPQFTVAGTRAFFASSELWSTDGTLAGTALVKDILPGTGSSAPDWLTNVNGTLYFAATGPEGRELWTSDGTGAGTMPADISPGSAASNPSALATIGGGAVLFLAHEPTFATELWTVSPGNVPNMVDEIEPLNLTPNVTAIVSGATQAFYFARLSSQPNDYQLRTARITGLTPPQTAWAAVTLPGKFECENYDRGGEGIAYHETTLADTGGKYRVNEAVDIATCTDAGGGFALVHAAVGEWTEYSVNVSTTGFYTLEFRVFTSTGSGAFRVEVDGVSAGSVTVPAPPAPVWSTVSLTNIALTAGPHVLRLQTDTAGADYNWINAVLTVPNTPPDAGVSTPVQGDIFSPGDFVLLTAVVFDATDSVASVEFILDGVSLGTDTSGPTWSWGWTAEPGAHVLRVRATDSFGEATTSRGRLFFVAEPLIATGADWLYSTKLYEDWHLSGYDDRDWPSGAAPLGFGFHDENTVIDGGPAGARRVSTWFRRRFDVLTPVTYATLKLDRDDGLVAWFNGGEALRSNMTDGPVTANTLAMLMVGPAAFGGISRHENIPIAPSAFVAGENVLAVELHQHATSGASSNDLRFDAAVFAVNYNPGDVLSAVPKSGGNFFVLWPDYLEDWRLQSSPDMITWTDHPDTPTTVAGFSRVLVDTNAGRVFYRLVR